MTLLNLALTSLKSYTTAFDNAYYFSCLRRIELRATLTNFVLGLVAVAAERPNSCVCQIRFLFPSPAIAIAPAMSLT